MDFFSRFCCCFKKSQNTLLDYDNDLEDYVYSEIHPLKQTLNDFYYCKNCKRQFLHKRNLQDLHLMGNFCIYCKK